MTKSTIKTKWVLLALLFMVVTQTGCGDQTPLSSDAPTEETTDNPDNPLLPQEDDDDDGGYTPPNNGDEGDVGDDPGDDPGDGDDDDDDDNDDDDGDGWVMDSDFDGVPDHEDNCVDVYNPEQENVDDDHFGNICDPDLDNDLDVDGRDYALFDRAYYNQDPIADFDSNGRVDDFDFEIFMYYYSRLAPGPSGPWNIYHYGPGYYDPGYHGGGGVFPGEDVLIYDSFDRGGALQLPMNDPIWDQLIFDNGSGAHVNTALYRSGEIVDTPSGSNAIFFKGRDGRSDHQLFLVADAVDATGFDSLDISMVYMPIDLEKKESVRIEYCILPAYQCDSTDPGLWMVVYQSDYRENADLGDMNEYNALDFQWFSGKTNLDLGLIPPEVRRDLAIRIAVTIDEGVERPRNSWPHPGESFRIEDGIAIDSFLVRGIY